MREIRISGGFVFVAFRIVGQTGHRTAHLEVGRPLFRAGVEVTDDRHGDDLVIAVQLDPTHPDRGAAVEDAHIRRREADRAARIGHQHDIIIIRRDACVDQRGVGVVVLELHGDLAVAHDVCEIRQLVPAHGASRCRKDHLQIVPFFFVAVHGHNRRNGNAGRDGQDINDRLAL